MAEVREQAYELVAVSDLTPHPENPNQGDVGAIAESVDVNGFYGALVVQRPSGSRKRGRILAGNHRWLAAKAQGIGEVPVIWVDVDDDRAKRIMLADNRTAQLASYDESALAQLLTDLAQTPEELAGTGWDGDALDELLSDLDAMANGDGSDADRSVAARAEAVSKRGDVWLCGDHRVVCGDAFDTADLDRMTNGEKIGCLLTDPPYGIDLDPSYSGLHTTGHPSHDYEKVVGDAEPFDASPLRSYFAKTAEQFWFGGDYYRSTLADADLAGSWIVWDKRFTEDGGLDAVHGSGFELIWTAERHKRDLLRYLWSGHFGGAEASNRDHPTQKPTKLLAEILTRWAPDHCIVADPFAGSGSTLIAAHRTGRRAYVMEIDPVYVDVICRRYQRDTGDLPILEATGEAHDFGTDDG